MGPGDILLLAVVCAGVTLAVLIGPPAGAIVRRRLGSLDGPRAALLAPPFRERVLAPAIGRLIGLAGRLTPGGMREAAARRLLQAGFPAERWLGRYLAIRALACVLGLGVGILVPELWLTARIARRRAHLADSLPYVVDLLTACVEAGLGFDAAVGQVVRALGPQDAAIRQELKAYLADVGLGRSRREALADLAERCGIREAAGLVAAVQQGEQLGRGIGLTLRSQSRHLRTRRRQRAQEAAMKAPVRMLLPLVLCIFPAMFIVILGPAAIQLSDVLGQVIQRSR